MHTIDSSKLTGAARAVIDGYLALPIGARPSCPYFNNRRKRVRATFRAAAGKGTPVEIAEECRICGKLSRTDVDALSSEGLKKFLIEEDLGVDCSGFAYHVLDVLSRERIGKKLASIIHPTRKGLFGTFIARLRPAENIGVATFADPRNSVEVKASDARPGDLVIILGTGKQGTYNHMLVVTEVKASSADTDISYAHSYAWPSDGSYDHGVREGTIIGCGGDLLIGVWTEKGKTGEENYTFESAKMAKKVSVHRLKFLG